MSLKSPFVRHTCLCQITPQRNPGTLSNSGQQVHAAPSESDRRYRTRPRMVLCVGNTIAVLFYQLTRNHGNIFP